MPRPAWSADCVAGNPALQQLRRRVPKSPPDYARELPRAKMLCRPDSISGSKKHRVTPGFPAPVELGPAIFTCPPLLLVLNKRRSAFFHLAERYQQRGQDFQ